MTDIPGVHPSLAEGRRLLGEACRLWVGDGTHLVEDGWWAALSGSDSVDYNVVCWHSAEPAVAEGLRLVRTAGVPAVTMLAGPALAAAQQLADAEWVCIGTTPVMALDLSRAADWPDDPAVHLVGVDGLGPVRSVVADTFGISTQLAAVAVPPSAETDPAVDVWTLVVDGELLSCVAMIAVEGVRVGWSMATPPHLQRRGLGRRLLTTMFRRYAGDGVRSILCYASAQGEPLYRQLGFEVMEHWQVWSRPRWVLGRA